MIRIARLDLDRFGHFSEARLDFGARQAGTPDFHIVHGSNEAGKTTTMEGFLRLLYGFPTREPYAFLHERKSLAVSGHLDFGDGVQALTRLPQRAPSLCDAAGQALPEQTLAAHLGGLGIEDYRNLLCLDDETIERGGEEIANARGDLGTLLFSAAAGIAGLSAALEEAESDADKLYRKRASKTRMAALKRELIETDRAIREADVTASAYRDLRQSLGRAETAEAEAAETRGALSRAEADATAARDALPVLAEIAELDGVIAAFPDCPERLDIDPEALVRMSAERARAEADIARLDTEIAGLSETLGAVSRAPRDLGLAAELEALDDLRSRFALAEKDLPRRRDTLAALRADMARAARDLDAAAGTEPEALVVSPAGLSALEAARESARDAARALAEAEAECARLDDRIARAADAAPEVQAAEHDVGAILERFAADTLAPRHAAARQAVADARRRAVAARDALAFKGQAFATLPGCPLTAGEAAALAEEHAALTTEARAAAEDLRNAEVQEAEAEAQIALLTGRGGLVDDAAALALRQQRDALWAAHRAALDTASADCFEAAMTALDRAAEGRLDHAADLGRLRQIEADAARLRLRTERAGQRSAECQAAQEALTARIAGAAAEAGLVAPLSPAAFADWVARLDTAADAAAGCRRVEAEHAEVFAQADRLAAELAPHIDRVSPDFDTLLTAARDRAAADRQAREAASAAAARLRELRDERARRRTERDARCTAAATAAADWRGLVADTFGGAVAADTLAADFEPLRALRECEAQRLGTQRQIDTMEADRRDFAAAMAALDPALAGTPPLEAFATLAARAAAAQAAEDRHADIAAALERARAARDEAQRARDALDATAAEIARGFPDTAATATLTDLRAAVAAAADVIDARSRRTRLARDLCARLDVPDLDAARAALAEVSATDLEARLSALAADRAAAESRYHDAIAARSAAARDLAAVSGSADVAALTERKATLELEMRQAALDWLELRLGHDLAGEAVRRYRDSHRSGMLEAAETAFADLTDGAYTRLRTQPEGGAETLIALTPDGASKRAQDMSKGTRFQLYLALRAAAYDQLARQGTVLPFFCDDIFETFDEDRTRAACRLMARIGRRGQAIYLTHHRHVVEIAREVCGDGVRVHAL